MRPGKATTKPEVLRWMWARLEEFSGLTSRDERVSVSTVDVKTENLPMRTPHRVTAKVLITYPDLHVAEKIEERMRALLGKKGPRWELDQTSDRPPMKERRSTLQLAKQLAVTPDLQFLINPATNPDQGSIWVFGLRGRLAL